jgi:hypothetical protein
VFGSVRLGDNERGDVGRKGRKGGRGGRRRWGRVGWEKGRWVGGGTGKWEFGCSSGGGSGGGGSFRGSGGGGWLGRREGVGRDEGLVEEVPPAENGSRGDQEQEEEDEERGGGHCGSAVKLWQRGTERVVWHCLAGISVYVCV